VIVAFSFGKGAYKEIARANYRPINALPIDDLLKFDRELPELTA
jgi:hypothetical protein